MGDFHQPRTVTTIHRLTGSGDSGVERAMRRWGRGRPVGLVLPALYTEFEHPAMGRIARELSEADFLRRIVVVLGKADAAQYRRARAFFDGFSVPVSFLLVDDPRVDGFLARLGRAGFPTGEVGKGRTCWLGAGYLLAHGDCDVVAFHDCDIRNYSRDILAHLCAPLAHPELGFEFAKGYYARVNGQLFGRLTRLLVTPLVQALRETGVSSPFLDFVGDLRYPLAGEMAMSAELALSMPTPTDWGLEVGTLAEVHRRLPAHRVCQVEVAEVYEHKHKPLSAECASQGLHRMAVEVGAALVRAVVPGSSLTPDFAARLEAQYRQAAPQMMARYRADACLNGLAFDEEAERRAISVFGGALAPACARAGRPLGSCLAPWRDIEAAFPRVLSHLRELVDGLDVLRPGAAVRVPVTTRVGRLITRRSHTDWAPASPLPVEDFA